MAAGFGVGKAVGFVWKLVRPARSAAAVGTVAGAARRLGQGRTIALGLDAEGDLLRAQNAGGIAYKSGAWQREGLTTVDWASAVNDKAAFMRSFEEAASKADRIIVDVTNFNYRIRGGVTYDEFMHIIANNLCEKTVFTRNGRVVEWTGSGFSH